jgi:serine/threonine-protein kinase
MGEAASSFDDVAGRPAQHDGGIGLARGESIAGYRVEAVAGQGSIGVVYRATQLALGRPVALKLIAAELGRDAAFYDRLERETPVAASIRHPNIVPVYETIGAGDRRMLVMRFVPGVDLGTLVAGAGALDPARAVRIVEQVAAALDAAHERGLVHGDVKPGHVLIADDPSGYASLTDFGVSTPGASSFHCVAPEQIRGERPSARSDVYALGCVLFFALTARPPFERRTNTARIVAHLDAPPPTPSRARPGVPVTLDAVVARALSKRAADRYADAGELAAAAAAALGGETVTRCARAVRRDTARPSDAAPPRDTARPSDTRRDTARLARRSWLVGRALVVAVAVGCTPAAALAAAGLIGGGQDAPDAQPAPRTTPRPPQAPAAPQVVATIPVGQAADGIAVANGDVWVVASRDNALVRVDARTDRVTARVPAGVDPDSVAAGPGAVWVTSRGDGFLRRFTKRGTPAPAGAVPVGGKPEGVVLRGRFAWALSSVDDTVTPVERGSAVARSPIGVGAQPTEVAAGPSGVWTTNSADGTVTHVDTATGQPTGDPIPVGRQPKGIVEAFGNVWVGNGADDTVSRIDPRSGRPIGKPIRVGDEPTKLAAGAGFVWVTNFGDGTVTRIDPRAGRIVGAPIRVGPRPVGIALGAGHIWVASLGDGTVTKIRP